MPFLLAQKGQFESIVDLLIATAERPGLTSLNLAHGILFFIFFLATMRLYFLVG
jgi:hypothetical protein